MHYLGVDTGGTFTDFVALNARTGEVVAFKVPSVPDDPARAVLAGIERLRDARGVDPSRIGRFVFGTTVATNAVLERSGARTALVATRGTRDVIEIQRLWRSRLFDLYIAKPPPLVPRRWRFEADERIGARGEVVTPLTDEEAVRIADVIAEGGFEAVAICGLFSFLEPAHERKLRDAIAAVAPDVPVSLSCEISPEFREYEAGGDDGDERVRDAADRPHRETAGDAGRGDRLSRPDPHHAVQRGTDERRRRAQSPGAHPALRSRRRRGGGGRGGEGGRARRHHRDGHGRHQPRHLPRARRRHRAVHRGTGRRLSGAGAAGRRPYHRRGRREHRKGGAGHAQGRSRERGRGPRAGLLRPGRGAADQHRRGGDSGLHQSVEFRRRRNATGRGRRAPRGRGTRRPAPRDGPGRSGARHRSGAGRRDDHRHPRGLGRERVGRARLRPAALRRCGLALRPG